MRVHYQDTDVSSAKALLRMTEGGKAERVIFSGNADIQKEDSRIRGEKITVMVGSGTVLADDPLLTAREMQAWDRRAIESHQIPEPVLMEAAGRAAAQPAPATGPLDDAERVLPRVMRERAENSA